MADSLTARLLREFPCVSVAGDPLADVTTPERIGCVMKGGIVYEADGKPVAQSPPFPLDGGRL